MTPHQKKVKEHIERLHVLTDKAINLMETSHYKMALAYTLLEKIRDTYPAQFWECVTKEDLEFLK